MLRCIVVSNPRIADPTDDTHAVNMAIRFVSVDGGHPVGQATRSLDAIGTVGESVGHCDHRFRPSPRSSSVLDQSMAVDSLRRCALFAHVEEDGLRTIAAQMRRRRFRRNEVIFHQGDIGDSLQIVASGGVKIVLPSTEGDEAIIASLKPGDFFGELALLDSSPRSTTATALEPTETLALPRDPFLGLLADDPRLVRALLHALAEELRRLTGHVEELHFLDLAGRLSMRLVRLARDQNPSAVGRAELDWPFTQSDLAAMIGGTRQSVNKLLSGLVDDGLITIERDTLVIIDIDELERVGSR
ncbi:MAG TPA: Crp/Fnr family transcriptional regulator [Candidatus Limnocylindria bacterium]|nr:Crp/Fnr family transcriptional regulator [Candidatus Limnocylindria bacterium]